jgi:DNA-binding transcriptional MocR family regulator
MAKMLESHGWLPSGLPGTRPTYLEIADSIAEDVRTGRLAAMDRLPPQRTLATHLGVNLATVARAYAEARHRGLIDSRVGDGTFIRPPHVPAFPVQIDLTMNLPPQPENAVLLERMRQGLIAMAQQGNFNSLLQYQEFGGSQADREAGAAWMGQWLPRPQPDELLVCAGAQSALLGLMSGLARPGSVICCEEVTYSGTKAIAAQLGIRLHGLPADDEGIDPDAFAEVCRREPPRALYLNPTFLNPTTAVMSLERRKAVVATARLHGVTIIEDDAYGMLPYNPPTQLAALAPELTYYVCGFAKCLGAGLRVAYLKLPSNRQARRLTSVFRATTVMASPLTVALASRWINDGTANAAREAIRRESIARQGLARDVLPEGSYVSKPEAFHLWLKLPPHWSRASFAAQVRSHGVVVVVSDSFTVGGEPPEAVRVCLGGIAPIESTRFALEVLADTLEESASVPAAELQISLS